MSKISLEKGHNHALGVTVNKKGLVLVDETSKASIKFNFCPICGAPLTKHGDNDNG